MTLRCSWRETENSVYNRLMSQFVENVARRARGGSYDTRLAKFRRYKAFISFISNKYTLEDIKNIQPKHIAAFIAYRRSRGVADISLLSDLSIIRWWQEQMPWRRFEMPDNATILKLEGNFNDKAFLEEIKDKYRRKKARGRRL